MTVCGARTAGPYIFVRDFGGGLVFIAGQNTVLEDLLPVRSGVGRMDGGPREVTVSDPEHLVCHYAWPGRKIARLPEIHWFRRVEAILPGAHAILSVGDSPLAVARTTGRGRVLWAGTDESWRWRYQSGDAPWFYPFHRSALGWASGLAAIQEAEEIRAASWVWKGTPAQVEQIQGGVVDYHRLHVKFDKIEILKAGAESWDRGWFQLLLGTSEDADLASELKRGFGSGEAIWVLTPRKAKTGAACYDWLRLPASDEPRVRRILAGPR